MSLCGEIHFSLGMCKRQLEKPKFYSLPGGLFSAQHVNSMCVCASVRMCISLGLERAYIVD